MSVTIHLWDPPEAHQGWSTKVEIARSSPPADVPHWERPFIEGDLAYIEGCFNGLAAGPVEGHVEVVLHESLCEVTGLLTVYDAQTHQSLYAVLGMATWIAKGIVGRYPRTSLRLRFEYALKWREDDRS
jgi:hypothetical protein